MASYGQFYQPAGIAIEFDNVVYVCDSKLAAANPLVHDAH